MQGLHVNEPRNLSNEPGQDSRAQRSSETTQPCMSELMTLLSSSIEAHQKATQALQELSKSIRIQANSIADLVEAVVNDDADEDELGSFQTLDGR